MGRENFLTNFKSASNFLFGGYMRSDKLQLPCVQPPTSSYNFQLPHGRHCHHGHPGHGGLCGQVFHVGHGGQDGTGRDERNGTGRAGRDETGRATCDWQLSKFLRCLLLCMLN